MKWKFVGKVSDSRLITQKSSAMIAFGQRNASPQEVHAHREYWKGILKLWAHKLGCSFSQAVHALTTSNLDNLHDTIGRRWTNATKRHEELKKWFETVGLDSVQKIEFEHLTSARDSADMFPSDFEKAAIVELRRLQTIRNPQEMLDPKLPYKMKLVSA